MRVKDLKSDTELNGNYLSSDKMSYASNELLTDFRENVTEGEGIGRKYESITFFCSHNYFRKLNFVITKDFFLPNDYQSASCLSNYGGSQRRVKVLSK